jgi:hypothetical protein
MKQEYEAEDKKLLSLVGKPYTRETGRLLKYGGSVDSHGNIAHVITRTEMEGQKARCTFNKPWYKRLHLEDWEKITIELIGIVIIVIIQFMALWTLDVSTGALISGNQVGMGFILTNGFTTSDPMQMYHLSLYMITVTTVLLCSVAIFYAVRTVAKLKK